MGDGMGWDSKPSKSLPIPPSHSIFPSQLDGYSHLNWMGMGWEVDGNGDGYGEWDRIGIGWEMGMGDGMGDGMVWDCVMGWDWYGKGDVMGMG